MTRTQATVHFRLIAAHRQLIAEGKATAKARRNLAEIVAYGMARGWNDAEGNPTSPADFALAGVAR